MSNRIAQLMAFKPALGLSLDEQHKQWGQRDEELMELFYDRHIKQQIVRKDRKARLAAHMDFYHGGGICANQIVAALEQQRIERRYPAPSGYQYIPASTWHLMLCELRELSAMNNAQPDASDNAPAIAQSPIAAAASGVCLNPVATRQEPSL